MILLAIDIDMGKNESFEGIPECIAGLEAMQAYYKKIGFNKPWIGYFASIDGKKIVGAAGYKGKPKDGKVEIAYGTFKGCEGQGIGTEICRQLVLLALQTDPEIKITARTFQDGHATMAILKKNGFQCLGTVCDEEDDEVLEWELQKKSR